MFILSKMRKFDIKKCSLEFIQSVVAAFIDVMML